MSYFLFFSVSNLVSQTSVLTEVILKKGTEKLSIITILYGKDIHHNVEQHWVYMKCFSNTTSQL